MGFLDKFKKQKEQEVSSPGTVSRVIVPPTKGEESKKADKKEIKKEKKAEKKEAGAIRPKGALPEDLEKVIIKPYITEKTAILAHDNHYVFVVSADANRIQVRNAVKAMYGITPVSVNIQNQRGKRVRFGRVRGQQKAWKKALVTVPKGTKIDVYEGV
ncbi:MAG: 50S ribosomal protein L23 [Candidatus Uhrbacteria bacterium]